jgi:1-aminocyclopropane-1-carboxylate deaminase/D-cysteine desulfhydrase-like pyridoxal-dependent ACC family enzyme
MSSEASRTFSTPSPEEKLDLKGLIPAGIEVHIKRDDLIHDTVSGNKWRKLKWNIENALRLEKDTLLTFGGAHSNHIAATAAAANIFGLKSIGILRGEQADFTNPTLSLALKNGMELYPVSRTEFRQIEDRDYIEYLRHQFGSFYLIPQGGQNHYGVMGCSEILSELKQRYDRIFVACGTATTLSGLVLSNSSQAKIYGVSVLKGGEFLMETVKDFVHKTFNDEETEMEVLDKVELLTQYHFGGYAKVTNELIDFMRNFTSITGVKLDPVYTAKSAFAMVELANKLRSDSNEKWLFIHTGGLQGIRSMEEKIKDEIYPDC